MTDLPKVSNEMVEDHARAVFAVENTVHTWDGCSESARQSYRDEARLHLTALVASGYRREVDVLRGAAEGLRKRERRLGERGISSQFISGINYAALALSVRANELDRATALEQAQPLPVAAWLPPASNETREHPGTGQPTDGAAGEVGEVGD